MFFCRNLITQISTAREMSMILSSTTRVIGEASDLNNCNYPFHTKRPRHESNISASRFKGVASRQWGPQIYAIHQWIWFGMFRSGKEAVVAYDSVAIKLWSGDSLKNFPWTNTSGQEPKFQNQFSTEATLSFIMIKDGSYSSRFACYLGMHLQRGKIDRQNLVPVSGGGAFYADIFSRRSSHRVMRAKAQLTCHSK